MANLNLVVDNNFLVDSRHHKLVADNLLLSLFDTNEERQMLYPIENHLTQVFVRGQSIYTKHRTDDVRSSSMTESLPSPRCCAIIFRLRCLW